MGGSAGQGQGRRSGTKHCLGTKALAIKSARWLVRARADDWLRIWAECNEASREPRWIDMGARRRSCLCPLIYAIGIFPWSYPLSMSLGEESPIPSGDSSAWWQIFDALRFTFNQLSHFLRLVSNCWFVPLSSLVPNPTCYRPCYSDRWSCVAWVVATACYGSLVPRGLLRGLSTSPSSPQAAGALG
jgi:hypothetical protein